MADKEIKPTYIRAFGRTCVGCEKTNTDIMISLPSVAGMVDIFLNQEVATRFSRELDFRLQKNRVENGI